MGSAIRRFKIYGRGKCSNARVCCATRLKCESFVSFGRPVVPDEKNKPATVAREVASESNRNQSDSPWWRSVRQEECPAMICSGGS